MGEKSLTFEEFYCFWLTLEQNTEIFQRILQSECFSHLFSKKDMQNIKTEQALKKKYDDILNKAKGLIINEEKIEKAQELLMWKNERKKIKFGSLMRASFYLSKK